MKDEKWSAKNYNSFKKSLNVKWNEVIPRKNTEYKFSGTTKQSLHEPEKTRTKPRLFVPFGSLFLYFAGDGLTG